MPSCASESVIFTEPFWGRPHTRGLGVCSAESMWVILISYRLKPDDAKATAAPIHNDDDDGDGECFYSEMQMQNNSSRKAVINGESCIDDGRG